MKVAIVGAGICGLYIAWKLAKKGEEVTVFEKREKIGKEACSGLFSKRILEFIPESQKLIQNQIDSVLIHFPRRNLKIKFSRKFLVINHFELDNLVAKLAERAGAKIILNHSISSIPEGFDRVIGCDGPNSIVRKSLGLRESQCRLGIQGFVTESNSIAETSPHLSPRPAKRCSVADHVETWPTKSGFIWKIPRGREIEYGIIDKPERAKLLLEKFLKENNLKLEKIKSALIPQGLSIPPGSKVTLCGDAAGLTKPWSGGGVVWGLLAAGLLLKDFPDFLKYKKAVEKFFSAKILFSKMATSLVYFLGLRTPWLLPREFKIEGDFLI